VYHGFNESLRPAIGDRKPRTICGVAIPPATRIVTYVSRGFESMRGFDIFMRVAKRIAQEFSDVVFMVVGTDRIAYGGDSSYIGDAKSFREWVLSREQFDLSRFHFLGQIPPLDLAQLLAATDLHIYLTVPFVLSWSMVNAMSCGAVVLGSATGPVQEMIREGENGLLADFFDVEAFATKAVMVLKDPDAFRPLGRAAEQMVTDRYSMEATIPRMVDLYERTVNRSGK
jgi:glycosyltransferase involved in cell wall biosynthesis